MFYLLKDSVIDGIMRNLKLLYTFSEVHVLIKRSVFDCIIGNSYFSSYTTVNSINSAIVVDSRLVVVVNNVVVVLDCVIVFDCAKVVEYRFVTIKVIECATVDDDAIVDDYTTVID